MTPQEQQMIQSLISRVNQTNLQGKDADAERLLQQGLAQNPDALYILAQTVIVQGYALEQAQKQLADARAQQQQPQQHTSFLGNLFGHADTPAPPPPPQASYAQQQAPAYAPVPGYTQSAPQGYGAPAGSGFLRGAMQTAAGVAAGALAFQGAESLMHGFGNAAGYGNENLGGFGGQPREEVINNYYGDSGDRDGGNDRDRSAFDTAADNNGSLSPDVEDRRNDGQDSLSGDDGNFDTSNDDGSAFDDNSSFDDGGGFDNSGGGDDSNFS